MMGFGPPAPAAPATLLELTDTPASYAGQALKLLKVNAGETASVFDLLLSFTDWYAGGAPTSYPWEFEADNPVAFTDGPFFSPMIKNDIGQYIVYAGYYDSTRFYRYNLTTKQWTRLADSPTAIVNSGIAMSPDGSKLIATGLNQNELRIYDVELNTWTTSPDAPLLSGAAPQIFGVVFADNDTVWCQVRKSGPYEVKFYRYVISTTTWTAFANSIADPADSNSQAMSISSDGLKLYAGAVGANYYSLYRYVISTDTYTQLTIGSGRRFLYSCDRTAKLWWWDSVVPRYGYFNCDTEANVLDVFPENTQRNKPSNLTCGVFGTTGIIVNARTTEPRNMSYFGTGSWRLASRTLTDYNLVVFKKPADGYAISAVDKVNGYYVPIHLFSNLVLPAGTWEFFYPKDGDYTEVAITAAKLA